MWALKVYIIPLERAIEHFPRTTSRTCACSRRTTRSSGCAESAVYHTTTRGPTGHSKKCRRHAASGCPCVLRDPLRPPNALVGAASPHPHGRRQRLPRVLGEQQQPHRGEHLGEREREGTERIFSGSRGLGQVVGRWEMISVLSNVSCVQLCQIDLCSGRRKKRVDTSVGSIEERCANGVCEERACCAASTQ